MSEARKRRRVAAAPPQAPAAAPESKEQRRFRKWIESYPAVSEWMAQYDLEKALDEGDGLAWLPNFLPDFVAQGFLRQLESLQQWNDTAADEDYTQNNIAHAFWSSKQAPGLDALFRVLSMLSPGSLFTFSGNADSLGCRTATLPAAKYTAGHGHIAPHDDRAYTKVLMEDGQQITCSRTIAVVYYLTQDWQSEHGGHLVDLAPAEPQRYVPQFNAAVVFRIPRFHEVTPVTAARARYSIFGWFLEPGKLYDLHLTDQQRQHQEQEQQQQPNQQYHMESPIQQPAPTERRQRQLSRHHSSKLVIEGQAQQCVLPAQAVQHKHLRRVHPVHMRPAPRPLLSSTGGKLRGPVALPDDW